jgi:hypothetical protein
VELEVEEVVILGDKGVGSEKRYRIRLKGTKIVLNIRAENEEEAVEKAMKILSDLQE